jgi:CheY-like chemotaxis protein
MFHPTILLIEDSETVRGFLRRLFAREMPEATLVEAADGRAALREMTRCRADLIVTDLQMPGMDGRSFIAKLRSNPLLKKKSVIVLSGDKVEDLRALYAGDMGIVFLGKPSGSEVILEAARRLFAAMPASTPLPQEEKA